jgi:hypothetical protein
MIEDPVVEEVRRLRAEYAATLNYDLKAICEDLQKRAEQEGIPTIARQPRPPAVQLNRPKKAG